MFLHSDEWLWLLNIYKARLLQICYMSHAFCNVYVWIIKYQLHFDFLVVFTPLLRPCQLLYHVSWLLYYWSLHFFFFVLTSGRPLPVTTFFVFLKPLCSHFAAQIVIRKFSAPLQKCCLSLSKGFPLQPKFATAAAQHFYSSFVALLEAILQRCSSAARFVQIWTQHFSFVRRKIDKGKNAPVSPPFCFPSCFFCVRCLQFNLLTPLSKCLEQVRSYK